ncbi:MAG: RIP metalloprotease RseP, partial [Gammaproteobacteria bacterium]|nr:RIP metalloprotease RseP [Gammaproteobacteria bacterium]
MAPRSSVISLRRGGTEYLLSAIPLGGYVKMVDEREGEVATEDLNASFNRKPLAQRTAIVAAGPIFNLLFAIFLYWLMFMNGVPGSRPILGEVVSGTVAAAAGVVEGDEILTVNGSQTPTWQAVVEAVLPLMMLGEEAELTLQRGDASLQALLVADFNGGEMKPEEVAQRVGLQPYRINIPAVIEAVAIDSSAARAGLQSGDQVLAIDGETIYAWEDLVTRVQAAPGHPLLFSLRRGEELLSLEVRPL